MTPHVKRWVIRVSEFDADIQPLSSTLWIFCDVTVPSEPFVVFDEERTTPIDRFRSFEDALTFVTDQKEANGQIILSFSEWMIQGVDWGEQHVLCTLEEWRTKSSFTTNAGINKTRRELLAYMESMLITPVKPKKGACLPFLIVLLILVAGWVALKILK